MNEMLLRRFLLALASLAFMGRALYAAVAPYAASEPFGLALVSNDALSEYRAVYTGMFLGIAYVLALAAWRITDIRLGDACAFVILGAPAGRIASLALDGLPGWRMLPYLALELAVGIGILMARHPRMAPPASAAT